MSCEITIPDDTVLGSNKFGGFVYNIDFNFGGFESPSTLKLSIVAEGTKNLSKPVLSSGFESLETIPIGSGVVFKGYLISYNMFQEANKRILEVEYIDGSVVLDRTVVILKHKHIGDNLGGPVNLPSEASKNIIVVGKEYHPCDKDKDSKVDFTERNKIEIDPCDPCPFCPVTKYSEPCIEREGGEGVILPVMYTFSELLSSLPFDFDLETLDYYSQYPQSHVGDLRGVLSSWCSDFALSYYWDPFENRLVFIDLKNGIDFDFNLDGISNAITLQEGETLEGTRGYVFSSLFERDGSIETYNCADERIVSCSPLFVSDLLGNSGELEVDSGDDGESRKKGKYLSLSSKDMEMSCALSYYSQAMWESYVMYKGYKIYNPEEALKWKGTGNMMANYGNMEIVDVVAPKTMGVDGIDSNWSTFLNTLPGEERSWILDYNAKNPTTGYYFLVVKVNTQFLSNQYEMSNNIATNFMGKYWYRAYSPVICGGDAKSSDISVRAPDGSGEFYLFGDDFGGHPLLDFGASKGSTIDKILKREGFKDEQTASFQFGGKSRNYSASNSFILVERTPKWYPSGEEIAFHEKTFEYYRGKISPRFINSDGRPDQLIRAYKEAKEDKSYALVLVKAVGEDGLPVTETSVNHFMEVAEERNLKRVAKRKDDGGIEYKEIGKTGLTSKRCKWVTFDGFGFNMPVGGSEYGLGSTVHRYNKHSLLGRRPPISPSLLDGGFNPMSSNYKVLVSQSFDVPVAMERFQVANLTAKGMKARSVEFISVDFSEENLREPGECSPKRAKIKEKHDFLEKFTGSIQTTPIKKVSFSVIGVYPVNDYNLSNGLESFTISFSDSGPQTSYVLSGRIAEKPSTDIGKDLWEKMLNKASMRVSGKVSGFSSNPSDSLPRA